MSLLTEYQYLYVTTSVYLGMLEAKLRGEKIPKDKWDQAKKLFDRNAQLAYLRFKVRELPHYNLDDILELITKYFGAEVDMDHTLNDLVSAENIMKEKKELQNGNST